MENGLKLRDLKRCRDTRPRASLGKAGIRLAVEVGPNRFRITFTARTLYIHPLGAPCSGVPAMRLALVYPWCALLAYILKQCAMVCTWCPGWSFALAKVGEEV